MQHVMFGKSAMSVALAALGLFLTGSTLAQNAQVQSALNRFARTETQRETARAIAVICPPGNRLSTRLQQDCGALVGAAFAGDATVAGAFDQLVADQTPVAANRALMTSGQALLQSRIDAAFTKAGPRSGGFHAQGAYSNKTQLGFDAHWPSANAADDDFGQLGFFANLEFSDVARDASSNQDGFDSDGQELTLGLERRFGQAGASAGVFGAALRYRRSDLDFTGGSGELDQTDLTGDVYFALSGASPWYLSGLLSAGQRDSDQLRRTRYTLAGGTTPVSVAQSYSSAFDSDLLSGALTLGYQAGSEQLSIEPYAQIEYAQQKVDGYDERAANPNDNGGGWAVRVGSLKGDTTSASVGLNVSWAISAENGVYQPFFGLRWTHIVDAREDDVQLQFLGDNASVRESFFASTDGEDDSFGQLQLGLSAQYADGISGFIRLARHFSESRFSRTYLQLGIRTEF
jgi:uncharacterized protein with beta-barrel porin domain